MQQNQNKLAIGCQPGPYQHLCMSRMPNQNFLFGQPPKPKKKDDGMQKIMPILNAISQMMGGGGSNAPEPTTSGGERMAITDGSGNTTGYGGADVSPSNLQSNSARGNAPIVAPFKHYFERCTQSLGLGSCTFKNLGIWGDSAHRARRSCHNSGEAIDVGLPFNCSSGGRFDANDPRAMQVAMCMAANSDEKFGVIFKDQTPARNMFPGGRRGQHNGHMHIQLKNCRNVSG